MEPVDRSTIWPYDERGDPRRFYYSRNDHPAGVAAELELGRREGGEALLYASGMGAVTSVLLAFARPGATVALAERCYYGTSKLLALLGDWGISYVEYDQTGTPPEADIVWVEAPANPVLTMPDWEALRRHRGIVVCDATIATPVYLRALDEGADVVLHSATKFLTGNHGALLGATVTRDERKSARLRELRTATGIVSAPDAAAALEKGLASLDERMARHTETATELARRLEEHPAVSDVRYPGFSGVISFDVADARAAETSTKLILNATSLGGAHSTMESRYRWEGDRIPEGLLRLSVGLEDVDALWADLQQALVGQKAHRLNL
ncbi:MAG: cystathionine gamma-synthase [Gaiellaceae bacterium]|jgi:cystathionine gamma-synthase|nr:cystathionine gamma-synthase [Gaiellaceae bacterium]